MHRFVLLAAAFSISLTAHAADPLAGELAACERFCKGQDKTALGLKATSFDGVYGRACVCRKADPAAAVQAKASGGAGQSKGAVMDQARETATAETAPLSDEQLLAQIVDCNEPQVKACAKRPALYNIAAEGLAERLPKGGRFDVTIIEVSDFECPYCARVQSSLKALSKGEYGSRLRFAFMHNPLSFHKRAMPAALAAEAARQQGQFWAMHDKLFSHQKDLSDANFQIWAGELGLDLERFKTDLANPALRRRIEAQQKAVVALGARGTPAFFINGRLISGAQPLKVFLQEVRFAIGDALRIRQRESLDGFVGNEAHQLRQAYKNMPPAKRSRQIYQQLVAEGLTEPIAAKEKTAKRDRRPSQPTFANVKAGADAIRGRGKWPAKVVIVEFSDFECPFCERGAKVMDQVKKAYGDDVYLIYRHLPLSFHKNAESAARAAEAAGLQGKFWPMHDKIFAGRRELSQANYERWARQLGLNLKRFKRAMKSKKVIAKVEADAKEAGTYGARGTPNFFVNGTWVRGALPFEHFKKIIDAEIERADALLKKGTPRSKLYEQLLKR